MQIWRRSFDIAPPPMEPDHPYYKKIRDDPRYKDGPSTDEFPDSESLKDTSHRTIPYWRSYIIPKLRKGHTILVVAHQNSLRALVKYLDSKYVYIMRLFIIYIKVILWDIILDLRIG